jgi:KaiC/GvpD/RAD55 family RecA-like ATPase
MKSKDSDGKVEEKENVCLLCGGTLNGLGECIVCGNKNNASSSKPGIKDLAASAELRKGPGAVSVKEFGSDGSDDAARDSIIMDFAEINGVGQAKAELLYSNGYRTLEDLANADPNLLSKIDGVSVKLGETIKIGASDIMKKKGKPEGESEEKSEVEPEGKPKGKSEGPLPDWLKGSDDSLAVWLGGKGKAGEKKPEAKKAGEIKSAEEKPGAEPRAKGKGKKRGHDDALRKWLAGEEDTLKMWLSEVEEDALPDKDKKMLGRDKELSRQITEKDDEIDKLKIELEEMKRVMSGDLKDLKKEDFDPAAFLSESAEMKAKLQSEMNKRSRLEENIKQVKKGSIAMVKYMKAQQLKKEGSALRRLDGEERAVKIKLEAEMKAKDELLAQFKTKLEEKLDKAPPAEKTLKEFEIKLAERESSIKAKEEELKGMEESLQNGEAIGSAGANEELRSKFQAELSERENAFLKKENELKKKIIGLEKDIKKRDIEHKQKEESDALRGKSAPEIGEELERKVKELQVKEKSILLREEEIQRLKDELKFKEDELTKIKEPLAYKEDEMLRREEDLLYREKKIRLEVKRLQEAKAKVGSMDEVELKERLETLKLEIQRKEEEVRAKEKYLKSKMEELRLREQGLIEEEIEQRDEERHLEITQEKVKTGTARLDDLLLGGYPFGSNVAIYGPPFVGKEVVVNAFMAEAVKKGVPVIWVITDKMPSDIREEMQFMLPSYEEYERLGLVKYIDSYSRSMGMEEVTEDKHTIYIDDPTDHDAILKAVDTVAKELKKKHEYYRVAFRSVSTLIAYLDHTATYKFLQPFSGRRKRDKAVSLFTIEKGMHSDQEIQMIGSLMDGMIEFKLDQLRTLFSIKGICDVQSRGWVRYTHSKQLISVGSFSLEAIR